tara:strand:- start:92 stop:697 length:606 start_codon:yes stop_codon:yes gene_type:complete
MEQNDNEQRLRILQERLGQIKDKKHGQEGNTPKPEHTSPFPTYNPKATQSSDEAVTHIIKDEKQRNTIKLLWKKITYLTLFIVGSIGGFYMYHNFDMSTFIPNSMEETAVNVEDIIPIQYSLDFGEAKHLVIIASLTNEKSAIELTDTKTAEGYKSNYFFLPSVSNSNEQFYKVYLGPYLSLSEANQWAATLEVESEILNL